MTRRAVTAYRTSEHRRRLALENLKRCTLCGALNARQNAECFVCRWHGRFQQDPDVIEEGLNELLDRCPELIDAFVPLAPLPRSPFERFSRWVQSLLRRPRLDISI